MPRHFGFPRKAEQATNINSIAGSLTLAIVLAVAAICKWGIG